MPGPNILIVHTDQHRHDALGCAGNPQIRTPHLDKLAADSVRFSHHFCAFPVCTPSRHSFLSGLYVRQHRGRGNHSTLAPGFPTFPRLLREAGYRTKAVGKMHFNPTYLDVGFDEMELAEQAGEGRFHDDYHRELLEHGLVDSIDLIDQARIFRDRAPQFYWDVCGAMASDLPEAWHSTTWIADRAVRTLERWDGTGNLLMAGFIKPHHPFDPPAPWDSMYDPAAVDLLPGYTPEVPEWDRAFHKGYFPNTGISEKTFRLATAYYYATISQIDRHVGRMLEALKAKGMYDDTLIVFTSDHGEYLGYHHMLLKGAAPYEPLVRVPLTIKFPGNANAGDVREALASNIDVAPTLLLQAGISPPADMTGLNLADPGAGREYVFTEGPRGQTMVRSRTGKLMYSGNPEHRQFFDLRQDPLEMANRHGDPACAAEVARHTQALLDWALLEVAGPTYRDPQAPQIRQPNVPTNLKELRAQLSEHFEKGVAAFIRGREGG